MNDINKAINKFKETRRFQFPLQVITPNGTVQVNSQKDYDELEKQLSSLQNTN
jgi:hypothetical protein